MLIGHLLLMLPNMVSLKEENITPKRCVRGGGWLCLDWEIPCHFIGAGLKQGLLNLMLSLVGAPLCEQESSWSPSDAAEELN